MPYLKITCSSDYKDNFKSMAERLTSAINDLFYNPKTPLTREELRARTTVHFVPYQTDELFIGGQSPFQRNAIDLTVEISDWYMSVKQQRKIATSLTPVFMEIFNVPVSEIENVNIRFHSYPPTDFAVGGKLLSEIIPTLGQWAKKILG